MIRLVLAVALLALVFFVPPASAGPVVCPSAGGVPCPYVCLAGERIYVAVTLGPGPASFRGCGLNWSAYCASSACSWHIGTTTGAGVALCSTSILGYCERA